MGEYRDKQDKYEMEAVSSLGMFMGNQREAMGGEEAGNKNSGGEH